MRRKEKEIIDRSELENIIREATICRVSMVNDGLPYIVPLSFGYKDNCIYVHCATKGKKIDILKKNPNICFEMDINCQVVKSDKACNWGMQYQSIIGLGKAIFLEDSGDKRRALNLIMDHYSKESFDFPEQSLINTTVIKVEIERMSGKQSGI